MRKKLAATVCVFAGVIISASLLIVSVLAATSASATITASVSYTPAIQAKVWLHDGGTYTDGTGSDDEKGMLIFDNTNNPGALYTDVTFSGGTINMPNGYKAVNGTTFKITVENNSESELIYFGLNISASSDTISGTQLVGFDEDDTYITWGETKTQQIGEITYNYDKDQIEKNTSKSISFTPEIVIPVTLSFNIALFTLQPQA